MSDETHLKDELARIRTENERLRASIGVARSDWLSERNESARLRAENERLDGLVSAVRSNRRVADAECAATMADMGRMTAALAAERASHAVTREALAHMTARADQLAAHRNALQLRLGVGFDDDGTVNVADLRAELEAARESLRQMDAINERLRGALGRLLLKSQNEGGPVDATEDEAAKLLGHTDDCEFVEHGVCTCAPAAAPVPLLCGGDVGGAACNRRPHYDRFHVYDGSGTESADRLAEAHMRRHPAASVVVAPLPPPPAPPAVPEKCGAPDDLTYPIPCPDCGAPWVMFHGSDDAGLVHGPFCPRKVTPADISCLVSSLADQGIECRRSRACTCSHAPEQHGPGGCEVLRPFGPNCACNWDGRRAPAQG